MLADRRLVASLVGLGAFAVALVVGAPEAHAFCRTRTVPIPPDSQPTTSCFEGGAVLYHPSQCVTYKLADLPAGVGVNQSELAAAARRAFATWSAPNATCLPGINVVEVTDGTLPTKIAEYVMNGPNQNVVGVMPPPWPHGEGNNTLALTTLTFNATTGEVFDADMELNGEENLTAQKPLPKDGYDLETIVLHEAGHFLGLAHSPLSTATMFASYSPGTSDLTLDDDDAAGVCAIYPEREVRNSSTGQIASTTCALVTSPSVPICEPNITHGCSTSPLGVSTPPTSSGASSGASWAAALVTIGVAALLRAGSRRRSRLARTRT